MKAGLGPQMDASTTSLIFDAETCSLYDSPSRIKGLHHRTKIESCKGSMLVVARTLLGGGHSKISQVGWRPSLPVTRTYKLCFEKLYLVLAAYFGALGCPQPRFCSGHWYWHMEDYPPFNKHGSGTWPCKEDGLPLTNRPCSSMFHFHRFHAGKTIPFNVDGTPPRGLHVVQQGPSTKDIVFLYKLWGRRTPVIHELCLRWRMTSITCESQGELSTINLFHHAQHAQPPKATELIRSGSGKPDANVGAGERQPRVYTVHPTPFAKQKRLA